MHMRAGKGDKGRITYVQGAARDAVEDYLAVRGAKASPLFTPIHRTGRLRIAPRAICDTESAWIGAVPSARNPAVETAATTAQSPPSRTRLGCFRSESPQGDFVLLLLRLESPATGRRRDSRGFRIIPIRANRVNRKAPEHACAPLPGCYWERGSGERAG